MPELVRVLMVPSLVIPYPPALTAEISPLAVLLIVFPMPVTAIEIAPPGFVISTGPLVGVPMVRLLLPVKVMPVSQELVTVVSLVTVGQVCAWTSAIARRVKAIVTAMRLILSWRMDLNSKVLQLLTK